MSSLMEDLDGTQTLTFNTQHDGDYLVRGDKDGVYLTISQRGCIITVALPSAAVAEKFGDLLHRMARRRRVQSFPVQNA